MCGLHVDYGPCRELYESGLEAGFLESILRSFTFPIKTNMWVYADHVEVSAGYRAPVVVLLDLRPSETQYVIELTVRTRCGERQFIRGNFGTANTARRATRFDTKEKAMIHGLRATSQLRCGFDIRAYARCNNLACDGRRVSPDSLYCYKHEIPSE